MFEHKRTTEAKDDSQSHRDEERQKEDSNSVKDGEDANSFSVKLGQSAMRLCQRRIRQRRKDVHTQT
jgi:hypothetical protein